MEQIYTGPGKITIELTVPKAPPKSDWKDALKFVLYGLAILATLTLLHQVTNLLS